MMDTNSYTGIMTNIWY